MAIAETKLKAAKATYDARKDDLNKVQGSYDSAKSSASDSKNALGIGVFTVDGKMIDIAFYDGAKRTIDLAKASGVYKGDL